MCFVLFSASLVKVIKVLHVLVETFCVFSSLILKQLSDGGSLSSESAILKQVILEMQMFFIELVQC